MSKSNISATFKAVSALPKSSASSVFRTTTTRKFGNKQVSMAAHDCKIARTSLLTASLWRQKCQALMCSWIPAVASNWALTTDLPVPAPPTSQNRRFSGFSWVSAVDDEAEDATEKEEEEDAPSLTHWRTSSNSHSLLAEIAGLQRKLALSSFFFLFIFLLLSTN